MTQKEFAKLWKERKKNKYYSKYVPIFDKKESFSSMINEFRNLSLSLSKSEDDFVKLDYKDRITILRNIFGNPEHQFLNNMKASVKNSIAIGNNVKIKSKEK